VKKIIPVLILVAVGVAAVIWLSIHEQADLAVGSKHFTEQKILGEMIAQLIEAHTDLRVRRRLGLQGTKVCFTAIKSGDVDIYPEYTGTGLVNILGEDYDPARSREEVLGHVREQFAEQWKLRWLEPLGFDNTYAFAMREEQAAELGIAKVSDLAEHKDALDPGFDHEYTMRPEFERFGDVYGFTFGKKITKLDPDLTYKALKGGSVDIIDAFSTDGRIAAYDLRVLEDDKNLFPPYDCCIVVREETLEKYPELKDVLARLAGAISPDAMRKMNYAVTDDLRAPAAVAREFLEANDLLP
jgi:glycine betaine/choline ABC-type transport system substrate-binding protein